MRIADSAMADASPAASLIVMRPRLRAEPELLIVQRAAHLSFAPNAYVFPGGRVDEADREGARDLSPDFEPDDAAARIAAIRETREETGLALSSPRALVPFARWRPHVGVTRRFDTRFYLIDGEGVADPIADGTESVRAFWSSAADLLARCAAGDGHAIFPTRRLLERLARFRTIDEARADALARPAIIITPAIERRADGDWLTIPEGAGYPITAERLDATRRG